MSSVVQKSRLYAPKGDMYPIVQKAFPCHRSKQGVFDAPRFAKALWRSHETVYRMLRNDVIKVNVAAQILELCRELYPDDRLYWEDLQPYVLPNFEEFSRVHADAEQDAAASDAFLGID